MTPQEIHDDFSKLERDPMGDIFGRKIKRRDVQ